MKERLARESSLDALARRIEADIRARSMAAGDRYHTSSQVAMLLGVSPATAHRAMNVLVSRKLLVREHGRGTFVGAAIDKGKTTIQMRTVFVLMEEEQRGISTLRLDDLVEAVRQTIKGVSVQFSFISATQGVAYARQLLQSAQQSGQLTGVIPISCPREVYRLLSDSAAPVVVLGSLYPDQWNLPSVDLDYRDAGALLTGYLIRRGHKRLALLTTGGGRPGDNALYDGISDTMTSANLPHNALLMRIFPHDFDAFRAQVEELMRNEDRPTGIICGSERLLATVISTAKELGLSLGKDLEVVFQAQSTLAGERNPMAHIEPRLSFRQIADIVAGMLSHLINGESLEQSRVVIPVSLVEPVTT